MNNRKGYKAFKKGLVCAPDKDHVKRYEENTVYEEDGGNICNPGMMHYCVNPLDCLDYYPLIDDNGDLTEFCEVEALEEPVTDDNKKFATKKLKIGAKLDFAGVAKAAVEVISEQTTKNMPESDLCSSGNYAQQVGGYGAHQVGSLGAQQVGGNYAKQAAGRNAVLLAGKESCFKAGLGSLVVRYETDLEGCIVNYKVALVDGETLKPDTWYTLENGEFVEV